MAIEMGNYHYIAKVGEELHFSAGFFQEKDGWGGGAALNDIATVNIF